MNTIAVVIARTGSTRLPGKILMDLARWPVLQWVTTAADAASGIDRVWVATTTLPGDDAVEEWCKANGYPCFRGSENDVLDRVMQTAIMGHADTVVRITADCPFIDSTVLSTVIRLQNEAGCHYASNVDPRTWPDGTDVECFSVAALKAAHTEATRPIDRECVTTWIQRNRSRFPARNLTCPIPNLERERWVIDTAEDLEFCRMIASRLKRPPSYLDILDVLSPEERGLARPIQMNERYFINLADEPVYVRQSKRSKDALVRSEKVIPLGAQTFSKSKLQFPHPPFLSHGQGGEVFDVDGNSFVDMVSALLPNILGYRDQDVDRAIRHQLDAGISFSLATELEAQLAETLCRLIPCAEAVRFGKTGTDATTGAIRLARAYTGRSVVGIKKSAYHGWGDWSVATTDRNEGIISGIEDYNPRFRDVGELRRRIANHPKAWAGIIVEAESSREELLELRLLCDQYGIVLIFDEIITGFRWHIGGAQTVYGIIPDLATFGKSMANGMPISAIVGRKDIMRRMAPPEAGENWQNIFYSGTFFGETLSIAAAIATIAKMERENVLDKIHASTQAICYGAIKALDHAGIGDAITIDRSSPLARISYHDCGTTSKETIKSLFIEGMRESGTLIIASHNTCYAHGPSEVARVIKSYEYTANKIASMLANDTITQNAVPLAAGVR